MVNLINKKKTYLNCLWICQGCPVCIFTAHCFGEKLVECYLLRSVAMPLGTVSVCNDLQLFAFFFASKSNDRSILVSTSDRFLNFPLPRTITRPFCCGSAATIAVGRDFSFILFSLFRTDRTITGFTFRWPCTRASYRCFLERRRPVPTTTTTKWRPWRVILFYKCIHVLHSVFNIVKIIYKHYVILCMCVFARTLTFEVDRLGASQRFFGFSYKSNFPFCLLLNCRPKTLFAANFRYTREIYVFVIFSPRRPKNNSKRFVRDAQGLIFHFFFLEPLRSCALTIGFCDRLKYTRLTTQYNNKYVYTIFFFFEVSTI